MATWIIPKTTWLPTDYINYTDYNRIKGDVEYLLGALVPVSNTDYPKSLCVYYRYRESSVRAGTTVVFSSYDCRYSPRSNVKLYKPYAIREIYTGSNYRLQFRDIADEAHPVMPERSLRVSPTGTALPYREVFRVFQWGITDVPDYLDMRSDKAVNDLWYADEVNAILDNIDTIAEIIGQNYDSRPFYYPNGSTPTAVELNNIERKIQLLYNRIGRLDNLYLGSGYLGSRMSNRIL